MTALRTTGLVVGATDPLTNKLRLGNRDRSWVRVIADVDGHRINAINTFDLTESRWLVVGMDIPITIDPERPNGFAIDWHAIPSMAERAAANHPSLADPISARWKAQVALLAANGTNVTASDPLAARFEKAMAYAAAQSAPAGKVRAIVHVAAITSTARTYDDNASGHTSTRKQFSTGRRKAVLSVNVPGQSPYALFQSTFKRPRGMSGLNVPALISSTDPTDVKVLWAEFPLMIQHIA